MNIARAQDKMRTLHYNGYNDGQQSWQPCYDIVQLKTPETMLRKIANALAVDETVFAQKSRKRQIVEARFIAALMLRRYYPEMTLAQIAAYFGGQDHSTIINAIQVAYTLLSARDLVFTMKYNTVLQTINRWLEKE